MHSRLDVVVTPPHACVRMSDIERHSTPNRRRPRARRRAFEPLPRASSRVSLARDSEDFDDARDAASRRDERMSSPSPSQSSSQVHVATSKSTEVDEDVARALERDASASASASASDHSTLKRSSVESFITRALRAMENRARRSTTGGGGDLKKNGRDASEATRARSRRARALTDARKKQTLARRERESLRGMKPQVEVFVMNAAQREQCGLDCDEMHFVPIGDASGWSCALLRYRARNGIANKRPVVVVPGCASNGLTFDVDRDVSLPRYLTDRGHEVWIVETRGVGYARQWTRARSEYVGKIGVEDGDGAIMEIPLMRSIGYGLWDFDTLLREDLFAACEYVAKTCGRGDLAGVGHSMGGMLLAALAAIGPKAADVGTTSSWAITRVVTLASCLECSKESDPESPASVYARFGALGLGLPKGLTSTPSTAAVQLPLAPASVATAEAFSLILGPPPPSDGDGDGSPPDAAKAFWRNSVSPVTCHPGATESEYLRRLLLRGFNNVPLSLLLQMAYLFTPGGMRSRDPEMGVDDSSVVRAKNANVAVERVNYLDALEAAPPPMCAIAGDVDPIFPPNQVKAFAQRVHAEYHCFGDRSAPRDDPDAHFSHYDVICGRRAPKLVFPIIADFVARDDVVRRECV